MFEEKKTISKYTLMLAIIIIFHSITNFIWQALNKAPPTWDSSGHLVFSYIFSFNIGELLGGHMSLVSFLQTSNYYPPFVHIIGSFIFILLGSNYEIPLYLVGTVFLGISVIYIYKIVFYHFKDQKLAILTVLIFSLFPQVWEQSRRFHLDIPLTGLLLVSYYHLVLSNSLQKTKHAILFFLFFAFAQLTKWYGFIYLVVPFVYEVIFKSYKIRVFTKKQLRNILIGAGLFCLIALPWYLVNVKGIIANVQISSTADAGDPREVLSFESIFHYLKLMTSHQVGVISLVLMLVSMYKISKRGKVFSKYLFSLIAFPYLVFTLVQNKDIRYILPYTPIIAFYISYLISTFQKEIHKKLVSISFCTFMLVMFFVFSFNQFTVLPSNLRFLAATYAGPYRHTWVVEPFSYAYNSKNWRNNEIITYVQALAESEGRAEAPYKVLELSDNRFYSIASFDLHKVQNDFMNLTLTVPYNRPNPLNEDELNELISGINYAFVPDNPGPPGLRNIAVLNQLSDYFRLGKDLNFILDKEFELPDKNVIYLYKRIGSIIQQNPNVKEESLDVRIGGILFLDRERIGGTHFDVHLYNSFGDEQVINVTGEGGAQRRIVLDGVKRIKIDIPEDMQNVLELRGWSYRDGEYWVDPNYENIIRESGNEFYYENMKIIPRSLISNVLIDPRSEIIYQEDTIKIRYTGAYAEDSVHIAYATEGWQWHNLLLTVENREVTISVSGLIQLEVSQISQLIVGFPSTWGFFPCYEGRAVCFYPH